MVLWRKRDGQDLRAQNKGKLNQGLGKLPPCPCDSKDADDLGPSPPHPPAPARGGLARAEGLQAPRQRSAADGCQEGLQALLAPAKGLIIFAKCMKVIVDLRVVSWWCFALNVRVDETVLELKGIAAFVMTSLESKSAFNSGGREGVFHTRHEGLRGGERTGGLHLTGVRLVASQVTY